MFELLLYVVVVLLTNIMFMVFHEEINYFFEQHEILTQQGFLGISWVTIGIIFVSLFILYQIIRFLLKYKRYNKEKIELLKVNQDWEMAKNKLDFIKKNMGTDRSFIEDFNIHKELLRDMEQLIKQDLTFMTYCFEKSHIEKLKFYKKMLGHAIIEINKMTEK